MKEGKVRNGDWVSLSESYVKVHGEHALNGNYRIMKEEVPAENLYWDGNDINEWDMMTGAITATRIQKTTEN